MRVALLTNFIPPYRLPLFEELQSRVSELQVFLSTPMENDRHWEANWGSLNVTVQRTASWSGWYRDPLGFSRKPMIHFPYDTLVQLKRYAPDIVLAGEFGLRSAQSALYCTLNPATVFFVWATLSEHSERSWGIARKTLRQAILLRADGVFVNGASGARYIARFGIPDSQIFRINQPVDIRPFNQHSAARPVRRVSRLLHSGALTSRKGVVPFMRFLLDWAARNPEKNIDLCWLGDGTERGVLEKMKLPNNVTQRFPGNRPYRELPQFYAEADILFYPTLMDEWGLIVNEAMASGLPVLGSIYSQAVEELVEDGVTGWTFDPVDVATVNVALDRVFALSPCALRAMGEAARHRIMTLTPAAASDQMVRAMRETLNRRRAGGTTNLNEHSS